MKVTVSIFCQYNPLSSSNSGGIGALIRSYISTAPENFNFEVIGAVDENDNQSIGCWSELNIGGKNVPFFPVVSDINQSPIPLVARYTYALYKYAHSFDLQGKVLHFHRPEPALVFLNSPNPKFLFVHVNSRAYLRHHKGFRLLKSILLNPVNSVAESFAIPQMNKVFAVQKEISDDYSQRFPLAKEQISFMPTWTDNKVFFPVSDSEKKHLRMLIQEQFSWEDCNPLMIFVGRLEQQKDPLRLLSTFSILRSKYPSVRLLIVGDGSLKSIIQKKIAEIQAEDSVRLLGKLPPTEIANLLRASDIFLLTSRYEGMPVAVLEALACGIPVVATDVGEVPLILSKGGGFYVAQDSNVEAEFVEAIIRVLNFKKTSEECLSAVSPYLAVNALAPFYKAHQEITSV